MTETETEAQPQSLEAKLDAIVKSVLYEGYMLYPYRPNAAKNRVRWTFGGIHPPAYSTASGGTEPSEARVTCLLQGDADAEVSIRVGFLQPLTRLVSRVSPPLDASDPAAIAAAMEPVDVLTVAGETYRSWEEAVEERGDPERSSVADLVAQPRTAAIDLRVRSDTELLLEDGLVAGVVTRSRLPIQGTIHIAAEAAGERLWRVAVTVANTTDFTVTEGKDRARAMLQALVSAHVVLSCSGADARWLSLADPPEHAAAAAALCERKGLWPLLIDADDTTVLASPIILEDHPEVAPESPGDLFDSAEIDEILTLRIMSLTDDEKAEMRSADARTRAMLERTESLDDETMMRLHGTLRDPGRFGDGDDAGRQSE